MIILDTNVVSEMLRSQANPQVIDWFDRQPTDECYLTSITAAELWYGAARLPAGRRREALSAGLRTILDGEFVDRILPFDGDAGPAYAVVVNERNRRGRPISGFDAQIAAICWVHQAQLATRNIRDFADTGIEVVDPWDPSLSGQNMS